MLTARSSWLHDQDWWLNPCLSQPFLSQSHERFEAVGWALLLSRSIPGTFAGVSESCATRSDLGNNFLLWWAPVWYPLGLPYPSGSYSPYDCLLHVVPISSWRSPFPSLWLTQAASNALPPPCSLHIQTPQHLVCFRDFCCCVLPFRSAPIWPNGVRWSVMWAGLSVFTYSHLVCKRDVQSVLLWSLFSTWEN